MALRQRHRRAAMTLGIFLPIVFAIGIAARKPIPNVAALPPGLNLWGKFKAEIGSDYTLFDGLLIEVIVRREDRNGGEYAVEFSGGQSIVKPDVLVYWIPKGGETNKLPANAVLLGGFNSRVVLPVPTSVTIGEGSFMLYSLAEQQVVTVSHPFDLKHP
ncbi:MAG TPA: hypothetical protein VH413_03120 [Verrucomicrobiae bacterium]|nr:hypothetical protein [Verrucomicrobiae bacterium]